MNRCVVNFGEERDHFDANSYTNWHEENIIETRWPYDLLDTSTTSVIRWIRWISV